MDNQDSFEKIAQDAVDLLTDIVADLVDHDDPADKMAALVIAEVAASFCIRAIKLGGV